MGMMYPCPISRERNLFYGFFQKPILPDEPMKDRDSGMSSKIFRIKILPLLA
jgi:hypothetical protein